MTLDELQVRLALAGIDTSAPGFYDSEAFLLAERKDPSFLELYATFVRKQPYSYDYLASARLEIERATEFVNARIVRLGACIDGSFLLQRILERRGVWAFTVKGALTIRYNGHVPPIPDGHYWPWHFDPSVKAGHCWITAPPYSVVDATIKKQPYSRGEEALLPNYVLDEGTVRGEVVPDDIMSPQDARLQFGRPLTFPLIEQRQPGLLGKIKEMGVTLVDYQQTTLKYVPCATMASEEPLEGMVDLIECGQSPAQLYADYAAQYESQY